MLSLQSNQIHEQMYGEKRRPEMDRETGSPADCFSRACSLRPGRLLPNCHAKVVCIGWRLVALPAAH